MGNDVRIADAKRWVTGHDEQDRSIVVDVTSLPDLFVHPVSGEGAADICISEAVPANLDVSATRPFVLAPPKGGVTTRLFSVAPGEATREGFADAHAAVRAAYRAIDGEWALVESDRHPAMHRTHTLDVVVVIQGELTLVLDEGEAVLRPGDSVVQRATSHAWLNRGDALAVAVVVLVDAQSA